MILDPRTVFIMGVGFPAVTTLTLGLLVPTLSKDTLRSALVGTLATASLGFSWALIALEGLIPEYWSLLGGNLLYLIAAELVYQSIRLLDGERVNRSVYLYVVAPAIVATLAASAGVLVIRVVATVVGGGAPPLIDDNPIPNLYVALSVIIALGAMFAYFLVFSGRVTAELAVQAHFDPLTELLNRRGFEERAKQELKRAARTSAPVSLLMIDANDFKRINDTWGHLAGDRALQAIANGLRARVRQYLRGRVGWNGLAGGFARGRGVAAAYLGS